MYKKIFFATISMFFAGSSMALAQIDNSEEPDDETTLSDDEIVVKDDKGNDEVIDFPEAMTYDLDSLMSLYMSKTDRKSVV